ncbi:MAG: crotonase/enoyl-CoA hydratase family protein [Pseudomonadota bacterium]
MKYKVSDDLATINIDDGKANVAGHSFFDEMNDFLQRAEGEAKAVCISARTGMFSAGFDLKEMQKGVKEMQALALRGMDLMTRLYAHPQPILAACDGHAVGLGAFLLLACDYRIGTRGDYNVTLPETALGMGFTPVLMALIHDRIDSRYKSLAVLQSKPFAPADALAAGFLDELVDSDSLEAAAKEWGETVAKLPAATFAANKEDLRSKSLATMRNAFKSAES